MQNSASAAYKFSKLDIGANYSIGLILSLQLVLGIIAALIYTTITVNYDTSMTFFSGDGRLDSS